MPLGLRKYADKLIYFKTKKNCILSEYQYIYQFNLHILVLHAGKGSNYVKYSCKHKAVGTKCKINYFIKLTNRYLMIVKIYIFFLISNYLEIKEISLDKTIYMVIFRICASFYYPHDKKKKIFTFFYIK